MNRKRKSAWLAASAAVLFCASACTSDGPGGSATGEVKCDGGNACKGKSDCQTAHSDCTGMNECKGKGWVYLSASECATAGGTQKTG